MAKRLNIDVSCHLPDDAFEQSAILAAVKPEADAFKAKLTEAITAAGGTAADIVFDVKVVNPPKGPRTRKAKNTGAPAAVAGKDTATASGKDTAAGGKTANKAA